MEKLETEGRIDYTTTNFPRLKEHLKRCPASLYKICGQTFLREPPTSTRATCSATPHRSRSRCLNASSAPAATKTTFCSMPSVGAGTAFVAARSFKASWVGIDKPGLQRRRRLGPEQIIGSLKSLMRLETGADGRFQPIFQQVAERGLKFTLRVKHPASSPGSPVRPISPQSFAGRRGRQTFLSKPFGLRGVSSTQGKSSHRPVHLVLR